MRSRLALFTLLVYLALAGFACSKPPSNSSADDASSTPDNSTNTQSTNQDNDQKGSGKAPREHHEAKRQPVVVPAGTNITASLASALGSKLSKAEETFSGSVAKYVVVGNSVVIPRGSNVAGTVTDAKPLGKFAGGAVLSVRLDSVTVNGADMPVQAAVRTFSAKGKGKRTAVMAGGGAALGGIIGGLAGGGKGAAIGMLAGGGAGTGGAALTGNKDIVLPAESAVSFELSQPLELR